MRVLYVDDDRINSLLFVETCRLAVGVEVATAESAQEALGLAAEFKPELLVIDLHLPDTSGYELLARLRAAQGPQLPPAILCTADDTALVEQPAREAGFAACWTKPVNVAVVLAELARRGGAA